MKLLEQMAANANLQDSSALANVIEQADISLEVKALIKTQDAKKLKTSLQLDGKIFFHIVISVNDWQHQESYLESCA